MLETVDMRTSTPRVAAITKLKTVSSGVTICRLRSGQFALSAHSDDKRVIIDLSDDECRDLVRQMQDLIGGDALAFQRARRA